MTALHTSQYIENDGNRGLSIREFKTREQMIELSSLVFVGEPHNLRRPLAAAYTTVVLGPRYQYENTRGKFWRPVAINSCSQGTRSNAPLEAWILGSPEQGA